MSPGAKSAARPSSEQVAALQRALAGEHAAVYVFSVLCAQTSQTGQPDLYGDLVAAWTAHRDARDHLVGQVSSSGAVPVAAAPSYALPNGAGTPEQVSRAALVTEQRMTDVYGTLVAGTTDRSRGWAIRSMDESAVRQLRLRGRPEIFPGTSGLGGRSG